MLKYYDSKKKLYLEVDASKRAVEMVLPQSVQNDHESKANDGVQESHVDTQGKKMYYSRQFVACSIWQQDSNRD